jgi:hypothetical protein
MFPPHKSKQQPLVMVFNLVRIHNVSDLSPKNIKHNILKKQIIVPENPIPIKIILTYSGPNKLAIPKQEFCTKALKNPRIKIIPIVIKNPILVL